MTTSKKPGKPKRTYPTMVSRRNDARSRRTRALAGVHRRKKKDRNAQKLPTPEDVKKDAEVTKESKPESPALKYGQKTIDVFEEVATEYTYMSLKSKKNIELQAIADSLGIDHEGVNRFVLIKRIIAW